MIITLEQNEKIITIARKHWFYVALKALGSVFFIVLFVFVLLSVRSFAAVAVPGNTVALFAFFLSAVVFISSLSFFFFWTTYHLDYWVITNHRIIDVDLKSLFNENIAMIRMDTIEDIIVESKGLFAHIFNFGSLHVQSAGAEREFVIRNVAEAQKLKDLMYRLHAEALEEPQRVHIIERNK